MSHNDIWQAVDLLAEMHDLSPSALAKKAGLDATTFNKSKRIVSDGRLRWPSTESIMRVLAATNTSWDEFVALMSKNSDGSSRVRPASVIHIPMLRMSHAGDEFCFDADGQPQGGKWDDIALNDISNKTIFAIELDNNHFAPLYRENDKLIVAPQTELRKGDRVFIRTKKNALLVKEIVRQTVKNIELKELQGEAVLLLAMEDIAVLGRIIWVSQ